MTFYIGKETFSEYDRSPIFDVDIEPDLDIVRDPRSIAEENSNLNRSARFAPLPAMFGFGALAKVFTTKAVLAKATSMGIKMLGGTILTKALDNTFNRDHKESVQRLHKRVDLIENNFRTFTDKQYSINLKQQADLLKLGEEIQAVTDKLNRVEARVDLEINRQNLFQLLNTILDWMKNLLDGSSQLAQGHLSPVFLPPRTLLDVLRSYNSGKGTKNREASYYREHELAQLYSLCRADQFISNNFIVTLVEVRIPVRSAMGLYKFLSE